MEFGTKSVKILRFNKTSQSSGKTVIYLSEWREFESKRIREFKKHLAMSKTPSRKKYGFSYDSNKTNCKKLRIWDTEKVFICFQVDIYYKWLFLNKWLSLTSSTDIQRSVSVPWKFHSVFGEKLKQFVIEGTKKWLVQQKKNSLLRRRHGVALEKKHNRLEKCINFYFK